MSSSELDFLTQWAAAKATITKLEKQLLVYRANAELLMDRDRVDAITHNRVTVKRADRACARINKSDVPDDVWHRYAKTGTTTTYRVLVSGEIKK